MRDKKFKRTCGLIFSILAVALWFLLIAIQVGACHEGEFIPMRGMSENMGLYGQYSLDGNEWKDFSTQDMPEEISAARDIYVKAHPQRDMESEEFLFFWIDNLRVKLDLNGENIVDFGEKGTYQPLSVGPGKIYITPEEEIRLTTEDTLDIRITNCYKSYNATGIANCLQEMLIVGPENTLYYKIFEGRWFITAMGVMFIIISLFEIGTLILIVRDGIGHNKERITQILNILTYVIFAFSCGYYLIMDSLYEIGPLILRNPVFCNVLDGGANYLVCLALCFSFLGVIYSKKCQRIVWPMAIAIAAILVGCVVLQLLGIKDFYEMEQIPLVLGFLFTILVIPCIIYQFRVEKMADPLKLLITFIPYIGCVICELIFGQMLGVLGDLHIAKPGLIVTAWLQFYRLIRIQRANSRRQLELEKTKAELGETRISMTISQIQPHFLYNALNTIQYLCVSDPEKAAVTVEKFSKYLRGNMDSLSQKEPIPFEKEMEHLENYLAIERLRFPDIAYSYRFDVTNFVIPALTIQPLVENSIKHGVRSLEEGAVISITTWADEENVYLRVEDNGIGFDVNAPAKKDGRSHVGMKNIVSRVESMVGGEVTVESEIGKGTRTTIRLPKGMQKAGMR